MNKLTIPNGGMPLHGDDFEFIHSANRDALKGLIHLYAAPHGGNMVLSGCEVAGATVSAGYVLLDYEVCFFPGGTLPSSFNDGPKFLLAVTYDPAGNDVFADSVSRNTYEVRRAVIQDSFTGLDVNIAPRLKKELFTILESYLTQAQVTSFFNGWSATGGVHVKLLPGGMKCLYGQLSAGSKSATSATKIFTLPGAEYRPDVERHHGFVFFENAVRHGMLTIKQDGDVSFIAGDTDAIGVVMRVCIVYR